MSAKLLSLEWIEDSKQFGWRWEIEFQDGTSCDYSTDPRGEGLFIRISDGTSVYWKQLKGTLQYGLPRDFGRAKAAICKEWFAETSDV